MAQIPKTLGQALLMAAQQQLQLEAAQAKDQRTTAGYKPRY